MSRVYIFDASALVKRYFQEKGTDVVDKLFDEVQQGKAQMVILSLSYLETIYIMVREIRVIKNRSRIVHRQFRSGIASGSPLSEFPRLAEAELRAYVEPLLSHSKEQSIIESSVQLISDFSINPNDALTLAWVLDFVRENPQLNVSLVASDKELVKVARKKGVEVIDPEESVQQE